MLEDLKDQIKEQLQQKPECRNSDITLLIAVWETYYGVGKSILTRDLYELPREDNIKRIRAKMQELALKRIEDNKIIGDEHFYLPTSQIIANKRHIDSEVWKKVLGYFNKPMNMQTEKLPNPVGHLGFTKIKDCEYLVDGARGKQYRVFYGPLYKQCECEAYRFHPHKYCKHILEIEKYLDNIKKEEARKNQTNLF